MMQANENTSQEQHGSNSDDGMDDKKCEMTENEKQIERLKLETEKALLYIKQENQMSGDDNVEADEQSVVNTSIDEMPVVEHKHDSTRRETEQISPSLDIKVNDKPVTDREQKEAPFLSKMKVPLIQVETVPTVETTMENCPKLKSDPAVKTEDDHPKGSSHTIIHEDHATSLNKLFEPAQNYQQYSPTLSHLNPQTINDSLTDALSKQQKEAKARENASTNNNQANIENNKEAIVKNALVTKPSIEIKRFDESDAFDKLRMMKTLEMVGRVHTNEQVDCSEDERSISPENMLKDCHKTYPQNQNDIKVSKPNLMSLTPSIGNLFMNPIVHSVLSQPQKTFEKSLVFKDLANKLSSTAAGINSLQSKLPAPTQPFQEYVQYTSFDPKNVTSHILNFLKPNPSYLQTTEAKGLLTSSSENRLLDAKPVSAYDASSSEKPSLLEQRLLPQTVKSEAGSTVTSPSGIVYLQPNISAGVPLSARQGEGELQMTDKIPMSSSFTITRDRIAEKPKLPPTSLRINPVITSEERQMGATRTWFPESVKDNQQQPLLPKEFYSNQPVSTSFRIPVTKTPSASNIHVYSPISTGDKGSKVVLKRSSQPIAIAPAPTSIMNVPASMVSISRSELTLPSDYTSTESG